MQALFEVNINGFEPLTANDNATERKKALVDRILEQHPDLHTGRANCRGKQVFVEVHFFLFNKTTEEGRYQRTWMTC